MIDYDQYKQEIKDLAVELDMLRESLHIDRLNNEISEMENLASEPAFWENVERAQKIQTKMNHLRRKIDKITQMGKDLEELEILRELGSEANDPSVAEDIRSGLIRWKSDCHSLRLETLFSGEFDSRNAILSLHAGAGGTEAQDWVEMLVRMYSRWAEKHDFEVKIFDIQDGDEAGIKSCTFMLSGENAYGYMRSEMGVHRLVRISPFDSSGRRHTSFASLEVIPELDNSIEITIKADDLRVDTYRSSGAGGQHVNKTDSAVRLTHLPTGIVVACQNERSQIQNRETAMNMLKAKLHALARASHMDRIEDLKGDQMDIAWGSQIRSYVFCPYTMVKDHRTGYETGNIQEVMDGELDDFIHAFLSGRKTEQGS